MKLVDYIADIFKESFRIIINPKEHWLRVKEEKDFISGGFRRFFLPGLIVLIVASILGDLMFESAYGFILKNTIVKIVRKILILVLTMLASNMLTYELSRLFRIPLEFETSRKIVTYSMLPLVLITILICLFPFFDVFNVAALYGFYLMYTGLNIIYNIRFEKHTAFIVSLMVSIVLSYGLISFLLSKLTALIIY